ncbi:MAG: ABC transporter ATP-binding protein [Victivallis sp.]
MTAQPGFYDDDIQDQQAFRKFIRYYRPYRGLFYFDTICALAVCVIDLAFPQILNLLTKESVPQPAETILSALWYIGAGLLAMYVVRYGCQYFITSWGHIMGARMESDMRQDLFNHYQRLSFTYYDRNNTGEMMSKLVSDLFDISESAHHGPENIVISTLKIIGAFTILMFMNVPMTLLLLAVTLIMVVFSLENWRMHRIFMDNRRKIAAVNARVQDSLSGIRVVKSFANEEVECEKFDDCNRSFLDSKTDSAQRSWEAFTPGTASSRGCFTRSCWCRAAISSPWANLSRWRLRSTRSTSAFS